MTLRRFSNSATIASIGSHGPSSAAIAACCAKAVVHDTVLTMSRVNGSTRCAGTAAMPRRHPVMANVFDHPSSRIVRSAMPSSAAMLTCSAP